MSHTQQAADELSEDQALNVLVNTLTDEFTIHFGGNADIDAETLFEVLVGACADETSLSSLCTTSESSPHENTVLFHLREQFGLQSVDGIGKILLQKDVLDSLLEQVEIVVDLHLRPYYGAEAQTDGLYHSEAKRGTAAFHAYDNVQARVRTKRYTLAVRRLEDGDSTSSVLAEFLGSLDGLELKLKAVYLDQEFSDSKCLTLLQAHNHAYVMAVVRWGRRSNRNYRRISVVASNTI